jgi:phage-related protein
MDGAPKPLVWVAASKKDFLTFPKEVVQDVGHALYLAQCGDKPPNAKPLKGFGGAGVLEVLENHDGDTYRAVYTVRFRDAIYVLHCFQKKSKSGIGTPQQEIELVKNRLKAAEEESKRWFEKQMKKF